MSSSTIEYGCHFANCDWAIFLRSEGLFSWGNATHRCGLQVVDKSYCKRKKKAPRKGAESELDLVGFEVGRMALPFGPSPFTLALSLCFGPFPSLWPFPLGIPITRLAYCCSQSHLSSHYKVKLLYKIR